MEHSTKLQTPCRPAHSRNSIRSAPSPALCCSDNRRQVSFQQHPPQELVKMERPSPAQSHSQSESSWKKKKRWPILPLRMQVGQDCYVHKVSSSSFSCFFQFRLWIKLLLCVTWYILRCIVSSLYKSKKYSC